MVFFLVFFHQLFSFIGAVDKTDFLSVFDRTLNICILIFVLHLIDKFDKLKRNIICRMLNN